MNVLLLNHGLVINIFLQFYIEILLTYLQHFFTGEILLTYLQHFFTGEILLTYLQHFFTGEILLTYLQHFFTGKIENLHCQIKSEIRYVMYMQKIIFTNEEDSYAN